jgi:hypothetical protein
MSKKKHFIDTSVARPIISSSSKVKEYYKNSLTGKLYYCTYIKMEIIRGYIIPCINFYFTFKMPNIESISDALSLWNQKFNTRELKAVTSMFSELLACNDFDFNNLKDKDKAAFRIGEYIRRLISSIPYRFTDIGQESKICAKTSTNLSFNPTEIDSSFKDFLKQFSSKKSAECNLESFIQKHQKEIELVIANKDLKVDKSNDKGFSNICGVLLDKYKCNCTTCAKLGDLIIAIIAPNNMRVEHTDFSFDYLCESLGKEHFKHDSEVSILKNH